MGKIVINIESKYDRGDIVAFHNNHTRSSGKIEVGIIESYYVDQSCDNTIWYNIRVSENEEYTYTHNGDLAEWDILGKLDDELSEIARKKILGKDYE